MKWKKFTLKTLAEAEDIVIATLAEAGIEAEVTLSDGVCRVLLADAADEPRARSILDANCGTLPCEIETGGDAP